MDEGKGRIWAAYNKGGTIADYKTNLHELWVVGDTEAMDVLKKRICQVFGSSGPGIVQSWLEEFALIQEVAHDSTL